MTQQQFYIEGMTCSACERTVENALSRLEGISAVHADRRRGQLKVRYDVPCTEETIIRAVEKAGYPVTERPCRKGDGVYLLVILLGLYLIARQLGWTEFFQRFPTISGEQLG